MGLKGFSNYLRTHFPTSFRMALHKQKQPFKEIYVDFNSLLHAAARTSTPESLTAEIIRRLNFQFSITSPTNTLYLAMDGPASLHKLDEQRNRRSNVDHINEETAATTTMIMKNVINSNKLVDSRNFSPGTILMRKIEEDLLNYFQRVAEKYSLNQMIISGASTLGEGEIKLFDEILYKHRKYNKHSKQPDKTCTLPYFPTKAMIAQDGDAFLYAIILGISNLEIVPPSWNGIAMGTFSTDEFIKDLVRQHTLQDNKSQRHSSEQLRMDLAVLVLTSGSDYTPGIPFAGYKGLINVYITEYSNNPDSPSIFDLKRNSINPAGIKALFKMFSKSRYYCGSLEPSGRNDQQREEMYRSIVSYLRSISWVINQIQRISAPNTFLDYTCQYGPPLIEFCHMDAEYVAKELQKTTPTSTPNLSSEDSQIPHPAISALLMLQDCKNFTDYLPQSIVPIAEQFNSIKKSLSYSQAVKWICNKIILEIPANDYHAYSIFAQPPRILACSQRTWIPYDRSTTFKLRRKTPRITTIMETAKKEIVPIVSNFIK